MATETWILITMLGISLILQLASMIATQRRIERLEGHTLSYRPWMAATTRRGDPRADRDALDHEQDEHSPLNDVFQRYSLLTDRMADLVFQLTAQRSRQQRSERSDPGADSPAATPASVADAAGMEAMAAAAASRVTKVGVQAADS